MSKTRKCIVRMIEKLDFSNPNHIEIVLEGEFDSPLLDWTVLLDGVLLHNQLDHIEPITGEDGKITRFTLGLKGLPFGLENPRRRDPETGLRPTTQGLPWNSVKVWIESL